MLDKLATKEVETGPGSIKEHLLKKNQNNKHSWTIYSGTSIKGHPSGRRGSLMVTVLGFGPFQAVWIQVLASGLFLESPGNFSGP